MHAEKCEIFIQSATLSIYWLEHIQIGGDICIDSDDIAYGFEIIKFHLFQLDDRESEVSKEKRCYYPKQPM